MERIESILDTGGRYLSAADRQFVSTLLNELEQFQYQAPKDRWVHLWSSAGGGKNIFKKNSSKVFWLFYMLACRQ